jgi:hypothetical protein
LNSAASCCRCSRGCCVLNEPLMGRDHPSNSCKVRVRLQLE